MVEAALVHFPPTRFDTACGTGSLPIADGSAVAQAGTDTDEKLRCKKLLEQVPRNGRVALFVMLRETVRIILLYLNIQLSETT